MEKTSKIYVVATPIGNLGDMTFRAVETLKAVDIIAAEDTRVSKRLLSHFGIKNKELISYYDQVEEARTTELIDRLKNEPLHLAIISDAGTPCISDPGYKIIAKAKEVGIDVHPIPGPSSVVSLVSAAGLPCNRFAFVGFLPVKPSAIKSEMATWYNFNAPVVFFESAKRLVKTLKFISENYEGATISIGRELTKMYEEIQTLSVNEAYELFLSRPNIKGELVCMLVFKEKVPESSESIMERLEESIKLDFESGKTHKDLLTKHRKCGLVKKELYEFLLTVRNKNN